jgi:hypothetical protein
VTGELSGRAQVSPASAPSLLFSRLNTASSASAQIQTPVPAALTSLKVWCPETNTATHAPHLPLPPQMELDSSLCSADAAWTSGGHMLQTHTRIPIPNILISCHHSYHATPPKKFQAEKQSCTLVGGELRMLEIQRSE